jgi:sarcosine oxidase subunit beta
MTEHASVVIAGAGIAGVSAAYQLAVVQGMPDVVLCDPLPPLTLTSDKSTECYRNWWPGPGTAMVDLMNRSIDLMEDHARHSHNAFNLSRRGYLFLTADPQRLDSLAAQASAISSLGAGELRVHRDRPGDPTYVPSPDHGFEDVPGGADLFLTGSAIRRHFSFISESVVGGLHARRAGWLSAQQYGSWMLDQAREHGARLVSAPVTAVELDNTGVSSVTVGNQRIATDALVIAAGPMLTGVAALVGERLPIASEVHVKTAFADHLGCVPRDAPMVIWHDPQSLDWRPAERAALDEAGRGDLTGLMPPACHARPEGGPDSPWVVGLWEYHRLVQEPTWPLPADELYSEAVIRGLTPAFPALDAYRDRLPRSVVDGGYYTKTPENRPLIGPTRTPGCFVVGALSGFGVMVAAAAGDLVARHVAGAGLPDYAPAFSLDRYDDPAYVEAMSSQTDSGQL